MIYNVCPLCGANLDPGEKCDCKKESKEAEEDVLKLGGAAGEVQEAGKRAILF